MKINLNSMNVPIDISTTSPFELVLKNSELITVKLDGVDREKKVIHVVSAFVLGRMKDTKTASGRWNMPLYKGALVCVINQLGLGKNERDHVFFDPKYNKRWKGD